MSVVVVVTIWGVLYVPSPAEEGALTYPFPPNRLETSLLPPPHPTEGGEICGDRQIVEESYSVPSLLSAPPPLPFPHSGTVGNLSLFLFSGPCTIVVMGDLAAKWKSFPRI